MVAAPSMLRIAGKTVKEACVSRVIPARFTCHCCYPYNQPDSLEINCSCSVCFSTLFFIVFIPAPGAEVGRYEHFVSYFLALVYGAFCFCLSPLSYDW